MKKGITFIGGLILIGVIVAIIMKNGSLAVFFGALLLLFFLIPVWIKKWKQRERYRKYGKMQGSAQFAGIDDIQYYDYGSAAWSESLALGWMYGKSWGAELDPRYRVTKKHVLTVAPTGSGKGVGCVIPTLLEYTGNVVCLDIKGENWAVTHERREAMGHKVFKLDPFGVCEGATDAVDVIEWLKSFPDDSYLMR